MRVGVSLVERYDRAKKSVIYSVTVSKYSKELANIFYGCAMRSQKELRGFVVYSYLRE